MTTNHSKPVAAKLGEEATVVNTFSVDVKGKRIDLKHRDLRAKYIEDITRWREDMNFIFEWQNNILRTSAASE